MKTAYKPAKAMPFKTAAKPKPMKEDTRKGVDPKEPDADDRRGKKVR